MEWQTDNPERAISKEHDKWLSPPPSVHTEVQIVDRKKLYHLQIRIILNKADTVSSQELMRIYGALFWSLAPLINVVEPPRVYIGSFWSKKSQNKENEQLFLDEEKTLIKDMFESMANNLEKKVAYVRQHAVLVRNHAMTVDWFLHTFHNQRSMWMSQSDKTLLNDIISEPSKFKIFETLVALKGVNKHDVPAAELYKNFFKTYDLELFKPLKSYCGFFTECLLTILEEAIHKTLPQILLSNEFCSRDGGCSNRANKGSMYERWWW